MDLHKHILKALLLVTTAAIMTACGGGGNSSSDVTPPPITNQAPIITYTVDKSAVQEGTRVTFTISASDDTTNFDPFNLSTEVPPGFVWAGDDPAITWQRIYYALEVDEDTVETFVFSVTDDQNLTTSLSVNVPIENIVMSPADDDSFVSTKGQMLGSGIVARVDQNPRTMDLEKTVYDNISGSTFSDTYIWREEIATELTSENSLNLANFSGSFGTQIEKILPGADEPIFDVFVNDSRITVGRVGDQDYIAAQVFEDTGSCGVATGKLTSATSIYEDFVIGLNANGIRLYSNNANLGLTGNAGTFEKQAPDMITTTGHFCDIALFNDPVTVLSSVDRDTKNLHIWENEFGSFRQLTQIETQVSGIETITAYDALANSNGDKIHAILSTTSETDGPHRVTVIVTEKSTGQELSRWQRSWTGDQPTSLFIGDLHNPMAQTSDFIDIVMAIPTSSHAGIIRDTRNNKSNTTQLNFDELKFAPVSIRIRDLSPAPSPNNDKGGFLALSGGATSDSRGNIILYDVSER